LKKRKTTKKLQFVSVAQDVEVDAKNQKKSKRATAKAKAEKAESAARLDVAKDAEIAALRKKLDTMNAEAALQRGGRRAAAPSKRHKRSQSSSSSSNNKGATAFSFGKSSAVSSALFAATTSGATFYDFSDGFEPGGDRHEPTHRVYSSSAGSSSTTNTQPLLFKSLAVPDAAFLNNFDEFVGGALTSTDGKHRAGVRYPSALASLPLFHGALEVAYETIPKKDWMQKDHAHWMANQARYMRVAKVEIASALVAGTISEEQLLSNDKADLAAVLKVCCRCSSSRFHHSSFSTAAAAAFALMPMLSRPTTAAAACRRCCFSRFRHAATAATATAAAAAATDKLP
jgi:hypothetical protein